MVLLEPDELRHRRPGLNEGQDDPQMVRKGVDDLGREISVTAGQYGRCGTATANAVSMVAGLRTHAQVVYRAWWFPAWINTA